MKFNTYYFQTITLIFALSLSACATIPSHLIIAPEIMDTPAIYHHNKQAQLNVIDIRTSNHVLQILRQGEAATLLSPQQSIENTIKNSLSTQWKKQGLAIEKNGLNSINIAIEKAVISVVQDTIKYIANTEIVLRVTINNSKQTLTSTFKNKGNSDGPLQADIAVLERNFNQRFAKLMQQILTNEKINNFLK